MSTDVACLQKMANEIRRYILEMAAGPEGAHVGGGLSSAEILAVLYFDVLRIRPEQPDWIERDHFVLSKGHASAALYAALALRGFFPVEELSTYARSGSRLAGHPHRRVPGVEFPTGSLGHGLSLGVGLALAARLDKRPNRVFILLGDGELQEGSVWEAMMSATHYQLDNVVAVIDRNGWQISGKTEECMTLEPLVDRWQAFGWEVRSINGHDVEALQEVFTEVPSMPNRPTAVVARTVKGRGVAFFQNRKKSHYVKLSPRLRQRALASLQAFSRKFTE